MNTNHTVIQKAWTSLTDQVRERREERAAERKLRQDLASYTTPAQIDDLLIALDRVPDEDAAPMRAILHANLQQHHRLAS